MNRRGWLTIGGLWLVFVIGGVGVAADLSEPDHTADMAWSCIRSSAVVFEDGSVDNDNERAIGCMKRAGVYGAWLEGFTNERGR